MVVLPSHGPGWFNGKRPRLAFMDLETFSPTPIKNGAHKYAEQAEVLIWVYADGDGDVQLWEVASGRSMPEDLKALLYDPDVLTIWHNGMNFDRTVLKHAMQITVPIERLWDTMSQAYAHALPGALDKLCEIFNLDEDQRKQKTGKKLIQLFCVPHKGRERATWLSHPTEWQQFCDYAKADIVSMREVFKKMPRWNMRGEELETYWLDAKINERGVAIDVPMCHQALIAIENEQARLAQETRRMTSGTVQSATQRDALLKFLLANYDQDIEDLTKATVSRIVDDPESPPALVELLNLRQDSTKSSTAKYKKFIEWTSSDGRLRGALQYCGAGRTRRWAGRGPQIHNMPRPTWYGKPMNEKAIEAGFTDDLADAILDGMLEIYHSNIMEACSSAIRGAVVAPPGKKLVVADLSAIEARVLAWLAGEEWVLEAFREYDAGTGVDQYKLEYSKSFGIPTDQVSKHQRLIGKVSSLACVAEGQLVLTFLGQVPIEDVKYDSMVWDGKAFVPHQGVIYKGTRKVLTYDGLTATPDHKVFIEGKQKPVHFRIAASSGSRIVQSGAGRNPIWVGKNSIRRKAIHQGVVRNHGTDRMSGMQRNSVDIFTKPNKGEKQRVPIMLTAKTNPRLVGEKNSCNEAAMRKHRRQRIQKLRSARDKIQIHFRNTSRIVDNKKSRSEKEFGLGPDRQQRPLRRREFTVGYKNNKLLQHAENKFLRRRLRRGKNGKSAGISHFKEIAFRGDIKGSNYKQSDLSGARKKKKLERNSIKVSRARVYDIVNAGPRHRFTVSNCLVSNCGYSGGAGALVAMGTMYKIDMEEMGRAAYDTIPESVLEDAEGMWEWAQKREAGRQVKRIKIMEKMELEVDKEAMRKLEKRLARLSDATFGLSREAYIAIDGLKRLYRGARPNIVKFWYHLEEAIRNSLGNPGTKYQVCDPLFPNPKQPKIYALTEGNWTRLIFPSGRSLCYPFMRIQGEGEADEDDEGNKNNIVYLGVKPMSKQWGWIKTYSGKLAENAAQFIARDVIAAGAKAAEKAGYNVVLSVHDEILTEVPDDPRYTAKELEELMSIVPPWAAGLPLAAAGFESYRYRK
jgi:DNA polymerase